MEICRIKKTLSLSPKPFLHITHTYTFCKYISKLPNSGSFLAGATYHRAANSIMAMAHNKFCYTGCNTEDMVCSSYSEPCTFTFSVSQQQEILNLLKHNLSG